MVARRDRVKLALACVRAVGLRMMLVYSFALALALAATAPVWGWRMLRQGRYREGLTQRLGAVPAALRAWVRGRPVVWVHAVSVGEVMAATRLVAELQAALPGHAVVVSTTTPTGQRVAADKFGADHVFFYPLDLAFAVRAYVRALQPVLLVLMESELWPRMLVECERANVPVAVANARVSDRSLPRYMRLRTLWRPLLTRVSLLLTQSDEDARRWIAIGARTDRVRNSGNLKYDVRVVADSALTALMQTHLQAGTKVLVCGSTHAGEEALLLDCCRALPDCVMVLAPRHPDRANDVLQLARDRDVKVQRVSEWRLAPHRLHGGEALLLDTVGELGALYSLANVAFVGGSLVSRGGQNPLEPAQFGAAVLMGPHYENFRAMVDAMRAADAIAIVTAATLQQRLIALLQDDGGAGERARVFYEAQAGATARTVTALMELVR